MSGWNIIVVGKGEESTITVRHDSLATAFSMTQQEARDLVSALSHVTPMPPRRKVGGHRTRGGGSEPPITPIPSSQRNKS